MLADKSASGGAIKKEIMSNQQLFKEAQNPMIRKFHNHKLYSSIKDNIWGADQENMQFISSKFIIGIHFLLCVNGINSKYALVVPLKDRKGVTITNAFQKIFDESNRKANEMWVDKSSEFYNRLIKSWLQNNDTEMYSTEKANLFLLKHLLEH